MGNKYYFKYSKSKYKTIILMKLTETNVNEIVDQLEGKDRVNFIADQIYSHVHGLYTDQFALYVTRGLINPQWYSYDQQKKMLVDEQFLQDRAHDEFQYLMKNPQIMPPVI